MYTEFAEKMLTPEELEELLKEQEDAAEDEDAGSMKIVYMGTPEIAKVCLEKLYTEGFDIAAVYTKPDTPKNRGMKLIASEVKTYAQSVGLPVYQPETFRDDAVVEELAGLAPDLILVVAYGKILPQRVLDIPKFGCINMHASILPELRGAGLCSGRFSITATRRA